ncbi:MAG: hypothetical protein JWR57_721 [Mycetocola sp.]|nr:hypothetical protein [Mycetocola sp.]
MSDETRRPQGDAETPVDPPTGEGEVVGADWLASQIDAAPTGQFDIRQAPQEGAGGGSPVDGGRAGNSSVLAWWREKLIAADALVNPEPRPEHHVEKTGSADTAANVEDVEPLLPEPAQFEPRRAENTQPPIEPETAFLPEPAFTPEPAWTPMVPGDADDPSLDRQPENELEDEAETGLIPTAEPSLYTPRSAREHVVEELDEPEPADGKADLLPTSAFEVPAAHPEPKPDASAQGNLDGDRGNDAQNNSGYETEDLDNFSWKLTANDQLDPLVHRSDEATDPDEASAGPSTSPSRTTGDQSHAQPVRSSEKEHEFSPPEPAVAPAAASGKAGPRRRTFTSTPSPVVPPPAAKPARRPLRPARPAAARAPRPVILAAIGVVALLVLGGLFFLGSQLPALLAGPAPTPTASTTPTGTATPTTPAAPVGPASVGEQDWTALGGGECIDPYSTPWAETFTVVDCEDPHAVQMVFTAPVAEDPAAEYPGEGEILDRISLWCSAPGVLDPDAADEYSDLQVQGTYPVTEEQWADGQRNYYCFVSRSSGEPLSGSVAAPQG